MARIPRKNVKDINGDIIEQLIENLVKHGSVLLVHFGLFKVRVIKGSKRYDFKTRKIIPQKPYKQIIFTPSRGIRDMLKEGKMSADSG